MAPFPKRYSHTLSPIHIASDRWEDGTVSKTKKIHKVCTSLHKATVYNRADDIGTGQSSSKGKAKKGGGKNDAPNTPPANVPSHRPQRRLAQTEATLADSAAQDSQAVANELEVLRRKSLPVAPDPSSSTCRTGQAAHGTAHNLVGGRKISRR